MLKHGRTHLMVIAVALFVMAGCGGSGDGDQVTMVSIPAGTDFVVALNTTLSTQDNARGDSFTATTTEPVAVNQQVIIPKGSTVRGTLIEVKEPGRVSGRAGMTLEVTEYVTPDGQTYTIETQPLILEADSGTKSDLEKIAAGTVIGAIIGGIAEGGEGAAVGAVIGAAGGGAVVLATKGDHLRLESGQQLLIEVTQPRELPVVASVGQNQ